MCKGQPVERKPNWQETKNVQKISVIRTVFMKKIDQEYEYSPEHLLVVFPKDCRGIMTSKSKGIT